MCEQVQMVGQGRVLVIGLSLFIPRYWQCLDRVGLGLLVMVIGYRYSHLDIGNVWTRKH